MRPEVTRTKFFFFLPGRGRHHPFTPTLELFPPRSRVSLIGVSVGWIFFCAEIEDANDLY